MHRAEPMPTAPRARPVVFQTNGRAWFLLPWFVLLAAAIIGLIAPSFSRSVPAWPFLLSAVVLGMPHGALDLHLWRRCEPTARGRGEALWVYLGLILAAGAVVALWPRPAVAGFGLLTVVHFGLADARQAARAVKLDPPEGAGLWCLGIGRGAFLLALPFAWSPVEAMAPVELALKLTGSQAMDANPAAWRIAGVGALAFALACLVIGVSRSANASTTSGRMRSPNDTLENLLVFHVMELAVLAAAAAVLSPMFFVGTYFLGWHALRHFAEVQRRAGQTAHRVMPCLIDLHRRGLPLLLPTLAIYAAAGSLLIGWRDPMAWATLLLLFFAVLTPAHHWLVERVQRRNPDAGASTSPDP